MRGLPLAGNRRKAGADFPNHKVYGSEGLRGVRAACAAGRHEPMYGAGYRLSGQGVAGGLDAVLAAIERVWREDV